MSELARSLPRVFLWGAQQLPDPDPSMSPEEVRDYYSELYPELTTAAVTVTEEAGVQKHTLKKPAAKAGTAKQTVKFEASQGKRG